MTVFDKSVRQDGTFSRGDFTYGHAGDVYYCSAGKTRSVVNCQKRISYNGFPLGIMR